MDLQSGAAAALILGFLLGIRHATDADHVVAVATIVNEYRNAWRGIWVGASWGLGHTTPLLILGVIILLFKEAVLDRYEAVAPIFEFGVAIMLIFLGVQVFWNLRRGRLHIHQHTQGVSPHVHIHATHDSVAVHNDVGSHGIFNPGRPFIRKKSFFIGMIHGLAGSAAVMLVLLPEVSSFFVGIGYLLMFGIGTMVSMAVITLILGVPFTTTANFGRLNHVVSGIAGGVSVIFGVILMIDLTLGTHLMPFTAGHTH